MKRVMIKITKPLKNKPYKAFSKYYNMAKKNGQKNIEVISISSFNKKNNEVESRYVNLKYLIRDEWIFFSNYNSKKSSDFNTHDQISALFFWNKINTQIRIKAKIKLTSKDISNKHFLSRDYKKNALAVSSNQSMEINSYKDIIDNYKKAILNKDYDERPIYWGGYSFTPYYFEFWEGHESRINKRTVYSYDKKNEWSEKILQP